MFILETFFFYINSNMEKKLYDEIIALAKKEVIPAIGCTEPIAVSLCVAKAKEILGYKPEKIKVYLSANVLKMRWEWVSRGLMA